MAQQYLSHSAGETEQIAADFATGLKSEEFHLALKQTFFFYHIRLE